MKFLKHLFKETCPHCKEELLSQSSLSGSHIVKTCPRDHFEKEFHPALETYIEIKA